MAKKNQCEWYDYIDDKPSKLHQDLIGKQGRPQGNLLYATYKSSDAAQKMDEAGFKRNTQGQHNAKDVLKFLDWNNISRETLLNAEKAVGARDQKGNVINYTDATEALQKADEFNDTRKHLVANVYKHGDVYNIVVSQRNFRTLNHPDDVKEKLKVWEYYKQVFAAHDIDITSAPDELKPIFSAYYDRLIERLQNIKRSDFRYMNKEDAFITFFLNANSAPVKRLVQSFGSIEEAAKAFYDVHMGTANITQGQLILLSRAIDYGKKFPELNLDNIQEEVSNISSTIKSESTTENILTELHKLNKKYNIEFNEIHRVDSKIRSLSDGCAEAIINLERQIREIEREEGKNDEGRRLGQIKDQLLKELSNKKYYAGILNYLQEVSRQLNYNPETKTSIIDDIIKEAGEKTGTDLEKAMEMAKALQRIKDLGTKFYPLVAALANENLTIDESIDQRDIDNIRNTAKALKELFDAQDNKIDEQIFNTMEDIMVEIVGNETADGISIHNALRMAAVDSSMYDYLYSMGRASNPIIAAMGDIIRKAQDKRDAIINDWSLRTRRATDKLYKSGSTSEFMYDEDGYIASPYDWVAFNGAKREYKKHLYAQMHDEWEIKQLVENWIKDNTEEIIVDKKTGRTERVPNQHYRKKGDFQDGWTEAQKEYYEEMMQIKGEIGSLLPNYAQQQFLPPQVRRGTLDALGNAKSAKDVRKALKNKIKDWYIIREDDTNFAENSIIVEGQERKVLMSDFDNTKLRHIPIFYINKVKEGELLKDFSGALSHLAGTAVNYNAMSSVADVVEFMGDFAKNQAARAVNAEVDVAGNRFFKVTSDVLEKGRNSNTENLVNSFIAQHLYGQKLDPTQKGYGWAKPILSLIGYTSFKGLATNFKGAFSNYLVGEFQMFFESIAGEFYNFKDYSWAHSKLFGEAGVSGEIADLLTNNVNHKSTLFREKFDPINENFSDKSNQRYYKSMFRQLVGHDCSFIGYASGEYLIHYVNMYSVLHNQKVLLNGEKICLYDAYEKTDKEDGNSELKLKEGVTLLDGSEITPEWEQKIRERIRYCNQSCHGSMNAEDKGIINQKLWGRAANNFRQWMWEHYSRRFRKLHYDYTLGEWREGYWVSAAKLISSEETKEEWEDKQYLNAMKSFMKDLAVFSFRAQAQWSNLSESQKYNCKRVMGEMTMYLVLLSLNFALGEPKDHKKEWWRRFFMYQAKRLILDTEAAMPNPKMISSFLTILQSPIPSVNTANSFLYTFYGLTNGDLTSKLKSGPHAGENKYWVNFRRNALPGFKDWDQLRRLDEDESLFQVFENSASGR